MALLEEIITTVQDDWGAIMVAMVTDTSGECWKMWWLLGHKYPHIVILDCYGHQVCSIDYDTGTYHIYRLISLLVTTSGCPLMFFSPQTSQTSSSLDHEVRLLFLHSYEKLSLTPGVLCLPSFKLFSQDGQLTIKHTNAYLSFKEHYKCLYLWKTLGLIWRNWLLLERGRPRTMQVRWWKSSQIQCFGVPLLSNVS